MGGVSKLAVSLAKLAKPSTAKSLKAATSTAMSAADELKQLVPKGNGWQVKGKKELKLLRFAHDLQVDRTPNRFDELSLKNAAKQLGGKADKDVAKWVEAGKRVSLYEGQLKKDGKTVYVAVVSEKQGTLAAFGDFHLYSKDGKPLAKLQKQPLWDDRD